MAGCIGEAAAGYHGGKDKMVNVIGVRFQNGGKLYFFDPGEAEPKMSDRVLVETSKGLELGEVIMPPREVSENSVVSPLKTIIRMASEEDLEHDRENRQKEKEAFRICNEKIQATNLEMKLVRAEIGFDNSKILFYFTANGRVDFRVLVKELASVFKTRIELRQIGVRDEARMIGGLGPCGRHICCDAFLADFEPVSIKMAKEQKLSLNPTKISGVCGRLMCCLKFEEEQYEQVHKRMPKIGRTIDTPDGPAVVVEHDILGERVNCRLPNGENSEIRSYTLEQLASTGAVKSLEPVPAAENQIADFSDGGDLFMDDADIQSTAPNGYGPEMMTDMSGQQSLEGEAEWKDTSERDRDKAGEGRQGREGRRRRERGSQRRRGDRNKGAEERRPKQNKDPNATISAQEPPVKPSAQQGRVSQEVKEAKESQAARENKDIAQTRSAQELKDVRDEKPLKENRDSSKPKQADAWRAALEKAMAAAGGKDN